MFSSTVAMVIYVQGAVLSNYIQNDQADQRILGTYNIVKGTLYTRTNSVKHKVFLGSTFFETLHIFCIESFVKIIK